jgi:hypothetical protein
MKFINILSYIGSIGIMLTLILWSYIEQDFYNNYIQGNIGLVIVVYIFPWVVIIANIWHYVINNRK